MKKHIVRVLQAAFAAFFIACAPAYAQTAGTVTNHAFAVGKGAGKTGYTSVLCGAGQIPIGQSGADPSCITLSGDATVNAAGVVAIGAGKVTNSMLAGSIAASKLVGTDIATVGTVTTGTWNAGAVTSSGAVVASGVVKPGTGTCNSGNTGALQSSGGTLQVCDGTSWSTVGSGGSQWVNGSGGAISYSGGNVGIGSSSPVNPFEVINSSANTNVVFGTDHTNKFLYLGYNFGSDFAVIQGGAWGATTRSLVLQGGGGNVGVGNLGPAYKFDVTGDINSSTAVRVGGAALRTKLTADTTYNVPAQFSTVCAAIDNLSNNIDGGNKNVTIQVADGSYNMGSGCYVRPTPGVNILLIRGNVANKQSVELYGSGSMLVQGQEPSTTVVRFSDLKFTGNAAGMLLASTFHGNVWAFNNIYWKMAAANQIAFSTSGGTNVNFNGAHSLEATGASPIFMFAGDNGFASMEPDFVGTVVGNPVMAATVQVTKSGAISAQGATWTNGSAATGNKWVVESNGTFDMYQLTGQIPGNSAYADGTATIKLPNGTSVFGAGVRSVSQLPTCNNDIIGGRSMVFDNATAVAFNGAVTGGGGFVTPVFCNGSSWRQG